MKSLLALTLAVSLVPATAFAQPVTIPHAQGETTIEGVPQIVFVQDWAVFDTLDALGIAVAGLPASNVPGYLADAVPADATPLGSLFEPDFEAIAAAEPDLYIVAGRSRTAYPTASEIVPTIDLSVDNASIIEGLKQNLETLGTVFGVEDRADTLIADLDAKVAEVAAAAEGKGTGLVIVTNAGAVGVYGPGSRVGWLYNEIGMPSAMADVNDGDHGGDSVSFEFLLEVNPDWVFVVDRDAGVGESAGAAAAVLDNALFNQTSAAQNGHIIYLDPQAAYITMHGYQGVMLLLDQVLEGLNS